MECKYVVVDLVVIILWVVSGSCGKGCVGLESCDEVFRVIIDFGEVW